MELRDKVVVVTGGAHGIGRAIAERTAAEGAAGVLIADLAGAAAEELAGAIGTRALARRTDVTVEAELAALIRLAEKTWGRLDVMCSNAGGGSRGDLFETANEQWEESFHLNTMAHVWAAKHALPGMLAGRGLFRQHRLGGRTRDRPSVSSLHDEQACGDRLRRMARHPVRRGRGFVCLASVRRQSTQTWSVAP